MRMIPFLGWEMTWTGYDSLRHCDYRLYLVTSQARKHWKLKFAQHHSTVWPSNMTFFFRHPIEFRFCTSESEIAGLSWSQTLMLSIIASCHQSTANSFMQLESLVVSLWLWAVLKIMRVKGDKKKKLIHLLESPKHRYSIVLRPSLSDRTGAHESSRKPADIDWRLPALMDGHNWRFCWS